MKHAFITLFLAVLNSTAASPGFAKVGDSIPNVLVQTMDGMDIALPKLTAKQASVIIFYRGGWCPFCNRHLAALSEIEADLKNAGVQLLALSPDQPEKLRETATGKALGYRLLSDSKAEAAKGFGIAFQVPDSTVSKYKNSYKIDLEAFSGRKHHLLPHPAVFIVDTKGVIRYAHVNENYKVRLDPQAILAAANNLKFTPPSE